MRVLMVNTADQGGGAERVVGDLRRGLRELGVDVRVAVGRQEGADPDVLVMAEPALNAWHRLMLGVERCFAPLAGRVPGPQYVIRAARLLGVPRRFSDWRSGRECFAYPAADALMAS